MVVLTVKLLLLLQFLSQEGTSLILSQLQYSQFVISDRQVITLTQAP